MVARRKVLYVLAGSLAWGLEWRRGDEDPSLARVRRAGRLRVGLDPGYPPFANVDERGELAGFDVDLARELAGRIGVRPEFVSLDVGGLYEAVTARQVDVAIGLAPVREFLGDLRYSQPYFDAGQVLVFRADSRAGEPSGALRGVGLEAGSGADLQWPSISRRLGAPPLHRATSLEALVATLRAGAADGSVPGQLAGPVDALVVDAVTGYELVRGQPDLALAEERLTAEPYVLVVHKHDARLLKEIDAVLARLEGEGRLAELAGRWLR